MAGGVTTVVLPVLKDEYDRQDVQRVIDYIKALEEIVYIKNRHVEIGAPSSVVLRPPELVLISPDGTRYSVVVADGGALSTVAASPL